MTGTVKSPALFTGDVPKGVLARKVSRARATPAGKTTRPEPEPKVKRAPFPPPGIVPFPPQLIVEIQAARTRKPANHPFTERNMRNSISQSCEIWRKISYSGK
ncbi:MAG: hypothetical protein BroJett009_02000 [Armatimonadota bacterium]|nr:MAG: hypothetical protein BroJett009_02000 [Armatimonadota bacterium]